MKKQKHRHHHCHRHQTCQEDGSLTTGDKAATSTQYTTAVVLMRDLLILIGRCPKPPPFPDAFSNLTAMATTDARNRRLLMHLDATTTTTTMIQPPHTWSIANRTRVGVRTNIRKENTTFPLQLVPWKTCRGDTLLHKTGGGHARPPTQKPRETPRWLGYIATAVSGIVGPQRPKYVPNRYDMHEAY